ncbi:T9SS type A sorting domain-containing protein [Flavitalea sp. BT771]|uniref:T9SS type A sorting domain-containing protein n=1 Tax=Flavitalea sp. BT771 TaxID=3063329 RepID=UPI0026E4453E|nr:T9SS type A sorting domain-containing protein [Flavitalea sp. BT771]MDO6431781.1 T9SS type A sorting domain-containing protein [Flavitalea sp. BT771]MDV6220689.1 T9SS type A sorting domain-containing protein [Flavitalea sp. BT771]
MKTINAATFTTALFTAVIMMAGATSANAQELAQNKSSQPALLMSFTSQTTGDSEGQLLWTMENLTNCKWFVIERSANASGFDSIGVVIGTNNTHSTDYTFTDEHLLSGNNYYRLRQVDMDGTSRYSRIVCLSNTTKATANQNLQVYPNPAISVVNYTLNSTTATSAMVQVYNMSGVLVLTQQQQLTSGVNQQSVAISHLRNGNYFLKVISHNGAQYEQTFVKYL